MDDEITKAEKIVGEVPVAEQPAAPMSDEEVMKLLESLMDRKGMPELCRLLLTNWRIYAVIRNEMHRVAGRSVPDEVFSAFLEGIGSTAMDPFRVDDLHRDAKKLLLPWLRDLKTAGLHANKPSEKLQEKS